MASIKMFKLHFKEAYPLLGPTLFHKSLWELRSIHAVKGRLLGSLVNQYYGAVKNKVKDNLINLVF